MSVSSLKCVMVILLLFFSVNTHAFACEGKERTKALEIIYESLDAGYRAGFTGNYQGLWSKVAELNERTQNLSPSCQALIDQVARSLQNRYRPDATSCHGDVCCDGSGCVSN